MQATTPRPQPPSRQQHPGTNPEDSAPNTTASHTAAITEGPPVHAHTHDTGPQIEILVNKTEDWKIENEKKKLWTSGGTANTHAHKGGIIETSEQLRQTRRDNRYMKKAQSGTMTSCFHFH